MSKPNIFLTVALTIAFGALQTINSRFIIDARNAIWVLIAVAAACVYAFLATKQHEPFLLSLGKLELIMLISQLVGFSVYALKSKAWQHRDIAAWLYFYPYLVLAGIVVFVTYSICFWVLTLKSK